MFECFPVYKFVKVHFPTLKTTKVMKYFLIAETTGQFLTARMRGSRNDFVVVDDDDDDLVRDDWKPRD